MLTRFMQRAYSDMDGDEGVARRIAGEVEEAERNGSKHTLEVRYVRMPDMVVKAIDNATGEETLIKRSGSCMVMRSDDGRLGAMRRHVLSAEASLPLGTMLSILGGRLSPSVRDMMFADYGTGRRVSYNLSVDEKRKLKDKEEEKRKQLAKVQDQLDRLKDNPNNQVVTDLGIETDTGVRDKLDELTAKRDLIKSGLDGINAITRGDHHAMDKAMQDTFRANDRLDVIDRNKERLKKDAEDRDKFDGGSGMDRYKGYGGRGVGNTKNAMQVRTESYMSDIDGGGDDRLFASRYVSSRYFKYGTTLSKDSPAAKGKEGSQGQNTPPTPQNSQNSTQNEGKPLDVNENRPSDSTPQPPPYRPDKGEYKGPQPPPYNPDKKDGEGTQGQPQHDYSADIKSVNDKMSGMEKQLGQMAEALKKLQNPQPQPSQQGQDVQQGQGVQKGEEQEGDESLAPSSSSTPTPPPYNPKGGGTPQPPPYNPQGNAPQPPPRPQADRNQVDWSKFYTDDPDNDMAYQRELNKLTSGYLNKWDDERGVFDDSGFWKQMQNRYGYQNPDVREREAQRLQDNASLQAYRAQQMANNGAENYGKQLVQATVNPFGRKDYVRRDVHDLNRSTYDMHALTLAKNLGVDAKYTIDKNGNASYYYDQAINPGRRLPGESNDAMLNRLRRQYGDSVQMTVGQNGQPQFSIRRGLGAGPQYVSNINPLAAWTNAQEAKVGRAVNDFKTGVGDIVGRYRESRDNGGNFFQNLARALGR